MAEIPISFGGGGGSGSDDVTASKNQVLAGYTAITTDSGDEPVEGTIPSKAAETYNTSTSDRTIASNQYLSGDQTIKAVTTQNIDAENIKKSVVVTVGDDGSATRIKNVTGTYTTVSSGQTGATAGSMLSGYSAFSNGGNEVKGSISSKAATTYNTSTSDQTIAASQYLSGVQTIKAVTTANIDAGNIKKSVVVKVGDANSDTRIKNVTGTYTTITSGQTAVTAGAMLSGYSGFANGGAEVKGSISSKEAATYTPGTANQTIAAGQYLSGAQTVKGDSNLVAANIKSGVTIFNVAGTAAPIKAIYGTGYTPQTDTSKKFKDEDGASVTSPFIVVSNHGFVPKAAMVRGPATYSSDTYTGSWDDVCQWIVQYGIWRRLAVSSSSMKYYEVNQLDLVLNSTSTIRVPIQNGNSTQYLFCWGY